MHIADFLSKPHLSSTGDEEKFGYINHISHLPIGKEKLDRIQKESYKDLILTVIYMIMLLLTFA